MIKVKRIYEVTAREEGYKVLVDGLWPRGMKKENAPVDSWIKGAGVSRELRKWFDHDPEKWTDFKMAYQKELEQKPEIIDQLKSLEKEYHNLTLLFSARNTEYNHAVALKEFLEHTEI